MVDPQASSLSGSEQDQDQHKETSLEESNLRLAQLQKQLPSNSALMHLVDVAGEDEDDEDTKECKKLFKNMKFFLSREVRPVSMITCSIVEFLFIVLSIQRLSS